MGKWTPVSSTQGSTFTASAARGAPPFFANTSRPAAALRAVVAPRLVTKPFGLVVPRRGGPAGHLAPERVVVGDGFPAIPVGIQAEAHDAQHEDWPQIQAGAARGFLARKDFAFQQGEDLGLECGLQPDPLPARENRRPFVAALARQANLFAGCDLQLGLGLEGRVPGGEGLPIGSPKRPKRS